MFLIDRRVFQLLQAGAFQHWGEVFLQDVFNVKPFVSCILVNISSFFVVAGMSLFPSVFCYFKGPMSRPFLLIIIPLLRSTRIHLHCAMFQTHIGFSYTPFTPTVFRGRFGAGA